MNQDDTLDVSTPDAAPKVAPENVTLRAQPRPVSRQNGDRVIVAGRDSMQDSLSQVGQ